MRKTFIAAALAFACLGMVACSKKPKPDATTKANVTKEMEEVCLEGFGHLEKKDELCKCFAEKYTDKAFEVIVDNSMSERGKEEYMDKFGQGVFFECAKKHGIDINEVK